MDHHAMPHGTMARKMARQMESTMVGSMMKNTRLPATGPRRRILIAAMLPSIALCSLLISVLPGYAHSTPNHDTGLEALQARKLVATTTSQTIVLAAKGGRLLKNGTRVRSNRNSEEKSENAAPNSTPMDSPAAAAEPESTAASSAASPVTKPVAPQLAPPATAKGPVELSEQLTPIAGLGRNPTDIECVANCPRSTPTTRMGGPRQVPDTSMTDSGMECIAGCYGVSMTSTTLDNRDLPAFAPSTASKQTDAPSTDGTGRSAHRVTVLRGVTRSKLYAPAN